MTHIIQFFALFFLMLVTGIFWGPWFSLHRSLSVFNSNEFTRIVRVLSDNLAIPMRFMMPACIIFLLLSVLFHPLKNSIGFYLNVLAFALSVISLLVTVMVEVPIVNQINQWTEISLPSNWESIRDRWIRFHIIRTFASILAFTCLSASILLLK